MAYVAQISSGYTVNGTSHTLVLPSSMTTGNLLLLLVGNGVGEVPSGLTDFTTITSRLMTIGYGWRAVAARIIDGSESSSITLTVTATTQITYIFLEITDWYGGSLSAIEFSSLEYGSEGWPRASPAHTLVGWGYEDTLWLSLYLADYQDISITSAPADFTLTQSQLSTLTNGSSLHAYQRTHPVTTLPADGWTASRISRAEAIVLAIRTAAATSIDSVTPNTGVLEV